MARDISYPASGHRILAALEETSFWFNHRNAVLAAALQNHPPSGALLDVGGGNGYVSLALVRAGFDSTVVEPGPDGARTARQRGLKVIEAAFQEVPIEPGSIQSIGAFDVIEHMEDDAKVLEDFQRLLPSRGGLYLTVPAYNWLWSMEDKDAGHFRRYSLSRLRARVEEAGFKERYSTYFFACLVLPVLALRTVPTVLGFRRDATPEKTAADHARRGGVVGKALDRSFAAETRIIERNGFIPFGTSILMIAEKP